VAAALIAACGKKGPPLPPLPRTPPAINDLEATLAGASLEIAWTAHAPLEPGAARVEHQVVWRIETAAPADAAPPVSAAAVLGQLLERGQRAGAPAVEWGAAAGSPGRRLQAKADLPDVPAGGVRVRVAVVARAGRHEVPSNLVTLAVPAQPLPAPAGVAIAAEPDGIRVRWKPLDVEARLELFRAEGGADFSAAPLVRAAPRDGEFLDRSVRLGERYRYAARLRAAAGEHAWAAGPAAEAGPLIYIDSFPPAPPRGLTALVESGGVRLLWSPNRETDLAGYRIYRRIGDGPEQKVWSASGAEVTWVDAGAPEGEPVEYRLTAFDSSPQANESLPSEPAAARVRRPRPPAAPLSAPAPGPATPGPGPQTGVAP
jgi:hypothetical protein